MSDTPPVDVSKGVETRAAMDNETVKALLWINGLVSLLSG
jgi:hypothetical protein